MRDLGSSPGAGVARPPRVARQLSWPLVLVHVLVLVLGSFGSVAAQVAPDAHWRAFATRHFRVTYEQGLDSLAHHAGAVAERAYARLARELTSPPRGKIDLVLSDDVDFSNGLTSVYPYDHIYLYARPPIGDPSLGDFPDWMETLVDHELTHAFHLDRTAALGHILRDIFGRVPIGWPVFPVEGTPSWSLEGMAVYHESHLAGGGRIYGSYHDMVLRTATLEGGFWPIDRLTGESPIWPAGDAVYIYGSYFIDWLAQRYGPGVERRIVDATASQRIPSFGTVARRVTGRSWPQLYQEWQQALRARYAPVADSIRARGLTSSESLTRAGYYALYPRVSPDGRQVAFAALDPNSSPETRVYDVASGRVRRVSRRNSLDAAAWLPDGRLLTTQLEYRDPYRVYSDLYEQGPDGGERRLTHGRRLEQLDVRRDGRAAVAVEDSAGMTRLVRIDLPDAAVTPLRPFDANLNWSYPRWSPDGRFVAVAAWRRTPPAAGVWSVEVLDSEGKGITEVGAGLVSGPTWSPDGRWLLWESDVTGIPNIYAANAADALSSTVSPNPNPSPNPPLQLQLHAVTNVLTGAYWPDVSPDGRWLYFSGYHADGWHLERMAFDTSAWTPVDDHGYRVPPPDSIGILPLAPADTTAGPVHGYSPWHTLWPRFWVPTTYGEAAGTFIGAATAGSDALNRHAYAAQAAYDFANRHGGWAAGYDFAGLGNPVLQLSASRSWDHGQALAGRDTVDTFRRDDDFAAAASFVRRRVRTAASLSLGADLTLRQRSVVSDTLHFRTPRDRMAGGFVSLGFANYQVHPYSISREDGIALSAGALRRRDIAFGTNLDGSYSQLFGSGSAYKGFPAFGFAHHVLALRGAALWRGGPGAEPFDVGGIPGQVLSLGIVSAGVPGDFLFVRGYPGGALRGTNAWSGSLEYRLPLALVGRGWGTAPYYVDRVFATAFADAGNAWCPASDMALRRQHGFLCSTYSATPLVGSGAELGADARLLIPTTLRFRAGIGFPLTRRSGLAAARAWVTLGSAF